MLNNQNQDLVTQNLYQPNNIQFTSSKNQSVQNSCIDIVSPKMKNVAIFLDSVVKG